MGMLDDFEGRLVAANAARFHEHALALDVGQDLVLPMAQITRIDAAGAQILLALARRLREHGRTLVLADLQPNVRGVLSVTGLAELVTNVKEKVES